MPTLALSRDACDAHGTTSTAAADGARVSSLVPPECASKVPLGLDERPKGLARFGLRALTMGADNKRKEIDGWDRVARNEENPAEDRVFAGGIVASERCQLAMMEAVIRIATRVGATGESAEPPR